MYHFYLIPKKSELPVPHRRFIAAYIDDRYVVTHHFSGKRLQSHPSLKVHPEDTGVTRIERFNRIIEKSRDIFLFRLSHPLLEPQEKILSTGVKTVTKTGKII